MKANTRMIQESVNDYNILKDNVTRWKIQPKEEPSPRKLWVKNLEVPCIRDNLKKILKNPSKQRYKTEEKSIHFFDQTKDN